MTKTHRKKAATIPTDLIAPCGMKKKNGFVPNVAILYVFINLHAFIVGVNGGKAKKPGRSLNGVITLLCAGKPGGLGR